MDDTWKNKVLTNICEYAQGDAESMKTKVVSSDRLSDEIPIDDEGKQGVILAPIRFQIFFSVKFTYAFQH